MTRETGVSVAIETRPILDVCNSLISIFPLLPIICPFIASISAVRLLSQLLELVEAGM